MKKRWWLLLGLLAMGAVVYAKESPASFVITSPSSLEERGQTSKTESGGFISKIEERLAGIGNKEEIKLAEPQTLDKKPEEEKTQSNLFEAIASSITTGVSEKTSSTKDKAAAIRACLEEAAAGE